jgi:iron complex outermembrane receptor protein
MIRRIVFSVLAGVALPAVAAVAQTAGETPPVTATLPTVEVIGTTPLPGVGVPRDEVPANVQTLPPPAVSKQGPTSLTTELNQRLGSININENQDNPFQPDVQYRGFEASPILGTPVGVAVYQNGVRLNEPFGDNINWDLIPQFAIDRLNVFPTNPIFGLNALGGAIVIGMKNGFNFQGGEAEASGGSFGRQQYTLQYGKQVGDFAGYIGANAYNDEGFREFSPFQVRQLYADVGAEGSAGSIHLDFTGDNNRLSGVGPTPIQLVDINRRAVFTWPQTFHNTLAMPSLNTNYFATDRLSFQSNVYVRSASRSVVNGNTTEAQLCADPTLLCFGDTTTPLIDTSGVQVPSSVLGGGIPGEFDDSSITSLGVGGALQATYTAPLFGRRNHLVVGASLDHADVHFNSTNELGIINPDTLGVGGLGIIIDQPDGSLAPISLDTTTNYYGLYVDDTLAVTPKLAVTLGGRYNLALVRLIDQLGTALNGDNRFARFNPAAGMTYKFLPNLTFYFGYAEANRAPTAGEIACSNPARPCSLDNFLTSDPPGLKQVVAHTYETGLRGGFPTAIGAGRVDWNVGLFRTDLDDDILNVPSKITSTGYFTNVGSTRRQGIEAGVGYHNKKWQVNASYALIDATFQTAVTLGSPNNPFADAAGNIQVRPGDHLPGIPQHRFKLDADYNITPKWVLGGDLIVTSSQYYFGDESNQNPPLPGYWVVNLHSSYHVTRNVQLFLLIQNLFNKKYATYGIFGDVTQIPLPGVPNPSDPRFISVAPPLATFGGIRITF